MMEVRRANGDVLTVVFSPEGVLSSAWLSGKEKANVSAYLPGLTRENAEGYLYSLGFREYSDEELKVGRDLSQVLLAECGAFVSGLQTEGESVVFEVCLAKNRYLPCPRVLLVGRISCVTGAVFTESVSDFFLADLFETTLAKYNTLGLVSGLLEVQS